MLHQVPPDLQLPSLPLHRTTPRHTRARRNTFHSCSFQDPHPESRPGSLGPLHFGCPLRGHLQQRHSSLDGNRKRPQTTCEGSVNSGRARGALWQKPRTPPRREREPDHPRASHGPAKEGQLSKACTDNVARMKNMKNPETASSSGATHVPSQLSTIVSPRTLPRCDSGLPRDTLNGTGITRNGFERPLAQEGLPSALIGNSKNLASSSLELRPGTEGNVKRPGKEMKPEPQNSSIPVPRCQSGGGILNHTGGPSVSRWYD